MQINLQLFSILNYRKMYTFKCIFLDFVVVILSLTVQINHYNYRLIISLSVGKRPKSAGEQIFFFPLYVIKSIGGDHDIHQMCSHTCHISYKEASCMCIRSSLLQSHLLHCMYTDRHRCTSAHTLSESMSTCLLSCPLQLALTQRDWTVTDYHESHAIFMCTAVL